MNFEFLKNLRGLGYVYENCSNAEKLAMTMPVQSVFTSRKSAELLAKFIYMAAHNQEMEGLTFADILSDETVRRFIRNRDVMNAFHYIRKSGNRAVHGDDRESPEEALAVLQDLHYVAGETACMLGLIDDYPLFEDGIDSFPEAVFIDEKDIDRKAREMFLAYVDEFNAQHERDQYIEQQDYDVLTYSVEGNVEMHEYLCFEHKPKHRELMEYIQSYLGTLLRLSIERSPENAEKNTENLGSIEVFTLSPAIDPGDKAPSGQVTLDAEIRIGEKKYASSDIESFLHAIIEELPKADGFVIDCSCYGILREFFNDELDEDGNGRLNMIRKDAVWTGAGLFDKMEQFKRREKFVYKLDVFYPDSGEFRFEKIANGKEIDVLSSGTEDIIDKTFSDEWWSWNLDLWADFDFEKYPEKLKQLQNIVRSSIPESEVGYCERSWEDGELSMLCSSIQWNCRCLREVQDFLDKLNAVLLPIEDEIDAGCMGTWEVKKDFAAATWDWTDKGFMIKGLAY